MKNTDLIQTLVQSIALLERIEKTTKESISKELSRDASAPLRVMLRALQEARKA